ncbi:MAG: NADH-quinone oxidoreductase subunit C [Thermaurantiacus sp.]|uniref:NADH-quinone oxidoreductase subunit C n=1 Tax=Thermaurantiacus sp. TaxID=2820283 RepID=UPI00298F29C2|nr:NADH-quinone oxidoreductase subunit C [Thermaurantiacus sp.]MDW8414066.1 NADH-quinone oxidoreductase subunit C [Thermaurantiacus sp.]
MAHWPTHASLHGLSARVVARLGDAVIDVGEAAGELSVRIVREAVADALRTLRDAPDLEFEQLMDMSGVDYPERAERFEVNYHLLSLRHNWRLRVKVSTDEETPVPTVTGVFPVAGWYEREVFDLYGVLFAGHPDLRRILTDYGFEGHPLRKDFPLSGLYELRYSETEKRIVREPVQLRQDYRDFDFLSPWEGLLPGDEKASP